MALTSPGVQVTIIDESNYTPAAAGTVPFIVVATAQDKTNPNGDLAEYTTAANAGKVFLVTSQRELISKYGKPNYLVSAGTPIHGYELNEHGLFAAYSALGVSNAAYIIRADVDLDQLIGSAARPTGGVANNTLWLDVAATKFGIFEWNQSTPGFSQVTSTNVTGSAKLHLITDSAEISGGEPISTVGKPGDYAIDLTDVDNPVFYKIAGPTSYSLYGQWAQVGSSDWELGWPAVTGTATANIATITGNIFSINGSNVTVGANLTATVANINAVGASNIKAAATTSGQLSVYCNANAGNVTFLNVTGTPLTTLGISANVAYNCPAFVDSKHTQAPAGGTWLTNGSDPRPTGSVWFKTTSPNNGASFVVKRYNSTSQTWTELTTPVYPNDASAIYALDPTSGGLAITAGKTYIQSDVNANDTFTFKLFNRKAGVTSVTGSNVSPSFVLTETFTVRYTVAGNASLQGPTTVTIAGGTNAAAFVTSLNSANIPNVSAGIETSGAITITHALGGVLELKDMSGTPLADAGITTSSVNARLSDVTANAIWVSNWQQPAYTVDDNEPSADPADGTYWYYNEPTEYDILINDGTGWRGYLNGGTDSRGFNLANTDPAGPIVSASEPTLQSDGTVLVSGDLWINTDNFEDFPKIYRYSTALGSWTLIDNTDSTSSDGIIFADARWGIDGTEDIITDTKPAIADLLNEDYTDPDCPSYAEYPRGILLFNTRRSGMNVKQFVVDHFAGYENPPSYLNAWVSASGNNEYGVAYMGRRAQRALVAAKMASAVSNSVEAVEEVRNFNLMCAPGYPELTSTLTTLNVNRKETAFIIVDSPLRLESDSNTLDAWSRNLNLAVDNNEQGFVSYYEYMAGYYPAGFTRDLDGNYAVVPASHMVLRSMIRSDQKSYVWFAPAGTRRGTVDNATAIGYIDSATGLFQSIAVSNNLRDVLYNGKVNPISVLSDSGITIYGQKTRSATTSALDRVNVARLVVYLRRQLDLIARQYIFEPNDEITRREIKNQIEKELNSVKVNRGLYDYAVVCDSSNNTPDRIDRNELWVDVAIEPVKAVEFIYIPVRIKNTGDIQAGL